MIIMRYLLQPTVLPSAVGEKREDALQRQCKYSFFVVYNFRYVKIDHSVAVRYSNEDSIERYVYNMIIFAI